MNKNTDFKDFIKYVSQNVMSMIGLSCYILADTFFIANGIGDKGLTALNLAIPVYSLVNGIGLMLGVGGATKYAITRAQGQKVEGNKIFTNMTYTALIIGAVFVVLGLFASGRIAALLGANQATYEMTDIYVKVIMLFSPIFLINNIINCFVKNDNNPSLAMFAMLCGCGFNIVFDYVFIFIAKIGMLGAVLATGFAPVVGLIVLSCHFIRKKNEFSITREGIDFPTIKVAVQIGIPSLVTELSSGIVIIIFNLLILRIARNVGVAAYGIIANISLVCLAIHTGIAQGIQPIISHAHGRGMRRRIANVYKYALITAIALSLIMLAFLCINADWVAMVFNRDQSPELQNIAVEGIYLYFTGIPFAGINIVLASYFASVERAVPAQIVSLLRGFILIIPAVFVLSFGFGLVGVWLAFPITEVLTVCLGLTFIKKR